MKNHALSRKRALRKQRVRDKKTAVHKRRLRSFKVKPKLTVEVGPMASGKSLRARIEYEMALRQHLRVVAFKPYSDTRPDDGSNFFTRASHQLKYRGLRKYNVRYVRSIAEIIPYCIGRRIQVVIFDEGQMFAPELSNVIMQLIMIMKCKIFFYGLDTTWRGRMYATTAAVMALPGAKIMRLKAVCESCGANAFWSQKRRHGKPVHLYRRDEQTQQCGGGELYEPQCGTCWVRTPGAKRALREGLVGTIDPDTFFVDPVVPSLFHNGPEWWPATHLKTLFASTATLPKRIRPRRKKAA